MKRPPTLKARQFHAAFIVEPPATNMTQLWSLKASEGIQTLIDFRSAVHRWQAAGAVCEREFAVMVDRLEDSGLGGWTDELLALGLLHLVARGEL